MWYKAFSRNYNGYEQEHEIRSISQRYEHITIGPMQNMFIDERKYKCFYEVFDIKWPI